MKDGWNDVWLCLNRLWIDEILHQLVTIGHNEHGIV